MTEKYNYLDISYFEKILDEAKRNHYQALLIAEPEDIENQPKFKRLKQEIISFVIEKQKGEYYNLPDIIARLIENVHPLMIGLEIQDKIHEIAGKDKSPVIFDDVGLMFSKDLKIGDPIRIFKYSSRSRPIILFVPLKLNLDRKTATFGNVGDEDYMPDIDISEIVVVELKKLGVDAL